MALMDLDNNSVAYLTSEINCWQHNARKYYEKAQFHKEQWWNGLETNLMRYESSMREARMFQQQAMMLLFAMIELKAKRN